MSNGNNNINRINKSKQKNSIKLSSQYLVPLKPFRIFLIFLAFLQFLNTAILCQKDFPHPSCPFSILLFTSFLFYNYALRFSLFFLNSPLFLPLDNINLRTTKNSRSMSVSLFNTQLPADSLANSPISSTDAAVLFAHTKKLVHRYIQSGQGSQSLNFSDKEELNRILKSCLNGITETRKIKAEKFVAYFSIFVYVHSSLDCRPFMLKYEEDFFKNISYHLDQILSNCSFEDASTNKHSTKTNLSIAICSIASLMEQSKKNRLEFDVRKIISSQIVKKLLSITYPKEEKYLKHYKVIILYLIKQKIEGNAKQLFLKSLAAHLDQSKASKPTQLAILYCLNKILDDKKFYNRISQILLNDNLNSLLSSCLSFLPNCTQTNQSNLTLDLCYKLASKTQELPENSITGEQYIDILKELYKTEQSSNRLHQSLQMILGKMNSQGCAVVFRQILKKQDFLMIDLEILQQCTKKMDESFLMEVLSSGIYNKIESSLGGSETNYYKYLMHKIMTNIIRNSEFNQQLSSVLKNLYSHKMNFSF